MALLRERHILSATGDCVQEIMWACKSRHPGEVGADFNSSSRVIVAAYMIACHQASVFESMEVLERALFEAAVKMIRSFELIISSVLNSGSFESVPEEVSARFRDELFAYFRCFTEWKVPDEARLLTRIRHALVAMYEAQAHLPEDEPENSALSVEFRTQIDRLRQKLRQIGGEAALTLFDEERQAPMQRRGAQHNEFSSRMNNEQLAYELLWDADFEIPDSEHATGDRETQAFLKIRHGFHNAFWNSLTDDLKLTPPVYVRLLRVLTEVCDGLKELDSQNTSDMDEIFNIADLQGKMLHNLFDRDCRVFLISAIFEKIMIIQDPKRRKETLDAWFNAVYPFYTDDDQPNVLCMAVKALLERLNCMRVDAANAR